MPVSVGFEDSATIKKVHLRPYLTFDGKCEEAFRFYEKCLSGKILFMMTYRDAPMAELTPPGWGDKIIHATLTVSDEVLQGVDVQPERYQKPQGFSLSLNIDAVAEAERVFNALSEGGTVQMPLQETFWALRFGMLVDRFGIPWMINCTEPRP
jgi:PhnB protein